MRRISLSLVSLGVAIALSAFAQPSAAGPFDGVWVGQWTGDNFVYAPELHLTVDASNAASGWIVWRLVKTDPSRTDYQGKVGLSGTEYVSGHVEGRALIMDGNRLDDPDHIIGMDSYRLILSDDNAVLGGITKSGGNWRGQFWAKHL